MLLTLKTLCISRLEKRVNFCKLNVTSKSYLNYISSIKAHLIVVPCLKRIQSSVIHHGNGIPRLCSTSCITWKVRRSVTTLTAEKQTVSWSPSTLNNWQEYQLLPQTLCRYQRRSPGHQFSTALMQTSLRQQNALISAVTKITKT